MEGLNFSVSFGFGFFQWIIGRSFIRIFQFFRWILDLKTVILLLCLDCIGFKKNKKLTDIGFLRLLMDLDTCLSIGCLDIF